MRFLPGAPASGVLDALECRQGLRGKDLELARVVLVRHSIVISSAAPAVCSSGRGCEILQASSGITIMILIYAEQLALSLSLLSYAKQPATLIKRNFRRRAAKSGRDDVLCACTYPRSPQIMTGIRAERARANKL